MRDVRDTNMCRIHARADEHTGKLLVFAAVDNLWKGTSSQAVQNLNLMFGLDETRGDRMSSDGRPRSSPRAGCRPRRTRASWPDAGTLPAGFRAAGVACGLKPSGGLDLGPAGVRRAGR